MTPYDGRTRRLQPIANFKRDGLWVCSACSIAGKWTKGWAYYGSYKELDDLPGGGIREVLCPRCGAERGVDGET